MGHASDTGLPVMSFTVTQGWDRAVLSQVPAPAKRGLRRSSSLDFELELSGSRDNDVHQGVPKAPKSVKLIRRNPLTSKDVWGALNPEGRHGDGGNCAAYPLDVEYTRVQNGVHELQCGPGVADCTGVAGQGLVSLDPARGSRQVLHPTRGAKDPTRVPIDPPAVDSGSHVGRRSLDPASLTGIDRSSARSSSSSRTSSDTGFDSLSPGRQSLEAGLPATCDCTDRLTLPGTDRLKLSGNGRGKRSDTDRVTVPVSERVKYRDTDRVTLSTSDRLKFSDNDRLTPPSQSSVNLSVHGHGKGRPLPPEQNTYRDGEEGERDLLRRKCQETLGGSARSRYARHARARTSTVTSMSSVTSQSANHAVYMRGRDDPLPRPGRDATPGRQREQDMPSRTSVIRSDNTSNTQSYHGGKLGNTPGNPSSTSYTQGGHNTGNVRHTRTIRSRSVTRTHISTAESMRRPDRTGVRQSRDNSESVRQSRETPESVRQVRSTPESVRQTGNTSESVRQISNTTDCVRQTRNITESVRQIGNIESVKQSGNTSESVRQSGNKSDSVKQSGSVRRPGTTSASSRHLGHSLYHLRKSTPDIHQMPSLSSHPDLDPADSDLSQDGSHPVRLLQYGAEQGVVFGVLGSHGLHDDPVTIATTQKPAWRRRPLVSEA